MKKQMHLGVDVARGTSQSVISPIVVDAEPMRDAVAELNLPELRRRNTEQINAAMRIPKTLFGFQTVINDAAANHVFLMTTDLVEQITEYQQSMEQLSRKFGFPVADVEVWFKAFCETTPYDWRQNFRYALHSILWLPTEAQTELQERLNVTLAELRARWEPLEAFIVEGARQLGNTLIEEMAEGIRLRRKLLNEVFTTPPGMSLRRGARRAHRRKVKRGR